MSSIPPSIDTINKALEALGLSPKKVAALGITNPQMASIRSFRFDLPSDKPGTVRRVKLTAAEDGKLVVQLHEVVEIDLIASVEPTSVPTAIKNLTGVDFMAVPE